MKKTLSILLALVLVFALATVAMADVQPPKRPIRVAFGTGSTGGNFYLVGGGMAGVMNNLLPEFFSVTAEETGGSSANLQMIENGEIDLGISMTSTIAEAVAGTAKWSNGKPSENIRGLVPLYPSYMTVYTLANSGIKSWSDFAGKIIGTGSSGAAMDSYMRKAFVDLGLEDLDCGIRHAGIALGRGYRDRALLGIAGFRERRRRRGDKTSHTEHCREHERCDFLDSVTHYCHQSFSNLHFQPMKRALIEDHPHDVAPLPPESAQRQLSGQALQQT